jgi:hydrogenase nickel incorporation protein HypA/HybF
MHELSIALSIVDMASEEASRRGASRVDAVHLRLGQMSGVVPRALLTSYDMACEGTMLAGSRLEIEEVPVRILCASCGEPRGIASLQSFTCATCGTPGSEVAQGREIEVVALELLP